MASVIKTAAHPPADANGWMVDGWWAAGCRWAVRSKLGERAARPFGHAGRVPLPDNGHESLPQLDVAGFAVMEAGRHVESDSIADVSEMLCCRIASNLAPVRLARAPKPYMQMSCCDSKLLPQTFS